MIDLVHEDHTDEGGVMIDLVHEDHTDEWWAEHDNLIAWELMWWRLLLIMAALTLYLVIFTDSALALLFVGFQCVLTGCHATCAYRHRQMHAEGGE